MRATSTCVILNPASGRKQRSDDSHDNAGLADNPRVTLRRLSDPSELTETVAQAVSDGFTTVVAAGGDGTVGGVAAALMGTGVKLGIVPRGTFNFLARSLDIPEDTDAALAVALDGADRPLTVGEVNGKLFLNNASLGAYASVLDVREGVYSRWGRSRLAAYWSVILAMLTVYRPLRMKITVDGLEHRIRTPMAFVAISAYQLEQYEFDGIDAVRDGKLAIIVAHQSGRLVLLWRAFKILIGGARRGEDYVLYTGSDITVETQRSSRLVARDGERERMAGPYRFRAIKDALVVKVPAAAQKDT